MIHELKTWPVVFQEVIDGVRTHDVRLNDRNYAVGDTLILREFNPASSRYTGRSTVVSLPSITPGGAFGVPKEMCVMSIRRLPTGAASRAG